MSDYYAPASSEYEEKLETCEELLAYLRRYLPRASANGHSKKGSNENGRAQNGSDDEIDLSSSYFLTEEEEGYYYEKEKEKEKERRKNRKKKTKKAQKTLYHPTRMFALFGLLETFPPTNLEHVPQSIEYIENFKEKITRENEERNAQLAEQRKLEAEEQEEQHSEYSIPTSTSTPYPSLLHASEGSRHDSDSHRDDDVSVAYSRDDVSVANSETRRREKDDVAMDEGEYEDLGDLDDLF